MPAKKAAKKTAKKAAAKKAARKTPARKVAKKAAAKKAAKKAARKRGRPRKNPPKKKAVKSWEKPAKKSDLAKAVPSQGKSKRKSRAQELALFNDPNGEAVLTERAISESFRLTLDRFVLEFVRDFDAKNACLRCGVGANNAVTVSQTYLDEPYVQRRVSEYLEKAEKLQLVTSDKIISALWKEAMTAENAKDRIAALNALAKAKGLFVEQNKQGGVVNNVIVVPTTGSVDDWERASMAAQNALKESVQADADRVVDIP